MAASVRYRLGLVQPRTLTPGLRTEKKGYIIPHTDMNGEHC